MVIIFNVEVISRSADTYRIYKRGKHLSCTNQTMMQLSTYEQSHGHALSNEMPLSRSLVGT